MQKIQFGENIHSHHTYTIQSDLTVLKLTVFF